MTYSIDPGTAPTAQNKNIQRKNIEEALLRLPWVSPTLGWPFWRDPSDLFHAKIWELTQKHCQKHSCQKSYRHCFTQHLFLYQQHVNTVRTLNRYHHDPESYQSNLQSTSELQIEAMIWLKCDNNEIFPLCLTNFRKKTLETKILFLYSACFNCRGFDWCAKSFWFRKANGCRRTDRLLSNSQGVHPSHPVEVRWRILLGF